MKKITFTKNSIHVLLLLLASLWVGLNQSSASGGKMSQCNQCQNLEIMRTRLKASNCIDSAELVSILDAIPSQMIQPMNEKPLLELRDLIRKYVGDWEKNKWTACDLLEMGVPTNLNVMALALSKTHCLSSPKEAQRVMKRVAKLTRIAADQIHNISSCVRKRHMPSPQSRGIDREKIFETIQSELTRLRADEIARRTSYFDRACQPDEQVLPLSGAPCAPEEPPVDRFSKIPHPVSALRAGCEEGKREGAEPSSAAIDPIMGYPVVQGDLMALQPQLPLPSALTIVNHSSGVTINVFSSSQKPITSVDVWEPGDKNSQPPFTQCQQKQTRTKCCCF